MDFIDQLKQWFQFETILEIYKRNRFIIKSIAITLILIIISLFPIFSFCFLSIFLNDFKFNFEIFQITQSIFIMLISTFISFVFNANEKVTFYNNKILLTFIIISFLFYTVFSSSSQLSYYYALNSSYFTFSYVFWLLITFLISYLYYIDQSYNKNAKEEIENNIFRSDKIKPTDDDNELFDI